MVKGKPAKTGEKINLIKEVLESKGITQVWLKEQMGYASKNTMANICNNISQPSLKDLKKMATILDVDIRELLCPTKANQP